jgi:diguanylate cyclase (GGDEF)-like protein
VDLGFNTKSVSTRGHSWLGDLFAPHTSTPLLSLMHPQDVPRFREFVHSQSESQSCDVRLVRNNEARWVNIRNYAVSAPAHYVLCIIDISQWKTVGAAALPATEHDSLTGLANRTVLQRTTDQRIEAGRDPFSIVILDLDGFKKVNDTYGHVAGDAVLVETTRRLLKLIGPEDVLARLGGDAFVLLYQDKNALAAQQALKNVLLAIARPYTVTPLNTYLGVSIGVAEYPMHGTDYSSLLKNADTAMYHSKRAGKNRISIFAPTEAKVDFSIKAAIHSGIQEGEFLMEFQPQYDMQRRLVGAEALMRWNNRTLGPIGPSQFIPVAEESGLMPFLGKWALRYACHQLKLIHQMAPDFVLSVNVSPLQFGSENFGQQVIETIQEASINPHKLVLEITESTLMENQEHIEQILTQLREIGVRFSIDDFGTGFSSLSYLTRLPVSSVKIDKAFISAMDAPAPSAQANKKLVTAMIDLSHSIDLTVVAEGVETEAQWAFLQTARCNYVQGYLTGKPMSAISLINRLPPRLKILA